MLRYFYSDEHIELTKSGSLKTKYELYKVTNKYNMKQVKYCIDYQRKPGKSWTQFICRNAELFSCSVSVLRYFCSDEHIELTESGSLKTK